jgi:hypothetical protein
MYCAGYGAGEPGAYLAYVIEFLATLASKRTSRHAALTRPARSQPEQR